MRAAAVLRTALSVGMVLAVLLLALVVRRAATLWAVAARRHGTRPAEAAEVAAVLTGAVAARRHGTRPAEAAAVLTGAVARR